MVSSIQHEYLFVAVPKTGTTSIQDTLMSIDDTAVYNAVIINSIKILIPEHARARDIKKRLGDNLFSKYKKIAFIRDPYAKAVSAYHFYKNGSPITRNDNKRKVLAIINVTLTRFLPFWLWVLLKPLKTNYVYLTDVSGSLIVDYIGNTERLNDDLNTILFKVGLEVKNKSIANLNKSTHSDSSKYFKNKIVVALFNFRYKKDIEFYHQYSLGKFNDY